MAAIDSLSSLVTMDGLVDRLTSIFASFGVEHFIVAGFPDVDRDFETSIIFKHWSAEWFDLYNRRHFFHDDPVLRTCRLALTPFEWKQMLFDHERDPRSLEMMRLASEFGLVHGFSIPIHGLDGQEACFSLSSRCPVFDDESKAAMHLIALYAFERARQIGLTQDPSNPLTAREREVLTWAAAGKSHADIAEILSVTERTVTAHTINATSKLGASNKTHAVVKAIQANYIRV